MAKEKKDKMTEKDLQITTQKTKGRVTQTSLKVGVEIRCSGMVYISCSTGGTRRLTLK